MAITNPDFDLSSSSSPVSKTDFDPPTTTAVNDSDVVFTDITTGNASATKHGFLKKLSNVATEFLNGAGNFVTLAQSSITDLVTDLAGKEATANKDATGGYAGLTLFKINFKNVANTFTSFFTNSNTAARTYTFQDRNGTIIDDTNLVTGSTDNAILRADGTGGKTSQSSGVLIDDSNNVAITSTGAADQLILTRTYNGGTVFSVQNLNNSAGAYAGFRLLNNANNLTCYMFSTSYTTAGRQIPGSALIDATGSQGLSLCAVHASGIIRFWTGGSNERMRIDAAGNVGIGGTANANAILDCQSTTKAFMPPRMTTTQRDAIASPTAGMVIYNSTTNKLNVYTTAWEAVTSV